MNRFLKVIKDYGLPYFKIVVFLNFVFSLIISVYMIITLFLLNRPLIIEENEVESLLLKIVAVFCCFVFSALCASYLFFFEKKIDTFLETK